MTERISIAEAFRRLGLEPTVGFIEVSHAHKELQALYGMSGLATYSLLNDEDRSRELAEINEAYRVLTTHFTEHPTDEGSSPPVDVRFYHADSGVSPAAFLRECRERDGLSLQSIAVQSKIGTNHLENIEAELYERLPAPVYLRGFIVEFARLLGISNPEELTNEYLRLLKDHRSS